MRLHAHVRVRLNSVHVFSSVCTCMGMLHGQLFAWLDRDGNGTLDAAELERALRALQPAAPGADDEERVWWEVRGRRACGCSVGAS